MFSGNRTISSSLSKSEPIDNDSQHKHHPSEAEAKAEVAEAANIAGSKFNGSNRSASSNKLARKQSSGGESVSRDSTPERQQFLLHENKRYLQTEDNSFKTQVASNQKNSSSSSRISLNKSKKKAKLAKEETIDETSSGCYRMVLRVLRRKRIFIPLIIITYIVAIYCLPYVDIQAQTKKPLPHIPFNFRDGPLRPSTVSKFKVERLFQKQITGAESVALDSAGNMYMAIEGGFVLYAHLNKSSPIKRSYYFDNYLLQQQQQAANRYNVDSSLMTTTTTTITPTLATGGGSLNSLANLPDLVKIAELNGIKQLPYDHSRRKARDSASGSWRRECQLDEKVYGQNLYSQPAILSPQTQTTPNEIDTASSGGSSDEFSNSKASKFISNVLVSRCSKPLGIRLSQDENYLYVVDSLSGLYRISLQVPDKPHSTQRLVQKLVDFLHPKSQMLPITQLDVPASQQQSADGVEQQHLLRPKSYINVTLKAVDDLAIDYGSGARGGDIIYMSIASQRWLATAFLYDLLEGDPSGAILRYDTGSNQLSILDPMRVAHVRTSKQDLENYASRLYTPYNESSEIPYYGIGAPRLDENDEFDDRPLHFPNGVQLTDDKQALLIADTSNRRIVKHYIKGPRKGTTDLWAWTPNFPDNIRRGYEKNRETYWVVGCGEDTTDKFDPLSWLDSWPRLRKLMLKQIYLIGWVIEQFGTHLWRSASVRDFGYSFKIGHKVLENMCTGMMVLQYNSYGDIIRSIYSKEFPNDLAYYSQVNEVIDAKNQEHSLYLSSPAYSYVTKLTFPTESSDLPTQTGNRNIR